MNIYDKQKYQIPVELDDERIADFNINPRDIVTTYIGGRRVRAIYVDCTEEVYREYMQPLWVEEKRRQRESRCRITNKFGNIVMCTGDCSKCDKKDRRTIISYDGLQEDGYDPEDMAAGPEEQILHRLEIEELLRVLSGLTPEQRHITDMIGAGMTDRQMAADLGITQSTFSYQKRKLLKYLKEQLG